MTLRLKKMKEDYFKVIALSLLLAGLSIVCPSCDSDETIDFKPVPVPTPIEMIGDYLKEVENQPGVMYCHDSLDLWYIEDEEKNRYYLFNLDFSKHDGLNPKKNVAFTGQVYALNEEWIEVEKELKVLSEDIGLYALWDNYSISSVDK